jgi:hypothetical protein
MDGTVQTWIKLANYKVDFRATCHLTNTLSGLHDAVGLLRAVMGALGLDNPVKSFWNLVPLSFVVDWFFGIDKHLDRLTRVKPATGWAASRVTHSIKVTAQFDVEVRNYLASPSGMEVLATSNASYRQYIRGIGLPANLSSLDPDGLSPEQLVLLLAILHQAS